MERGARAGVVPAGDGNGGGAILRAALRRARPAWVAGQPTMISNTALITAAATVPQVSVVVERSTISFTPVSLQPLMDER